MLKVNLDAVTDEKGDLQLRRINSVDATAYGNEEAAVRATLSFMEKQKLSSLWVNFGQGTVSLKTGDDIAQKADELFYDSKVFDLNRITNWNAPQWNLGEADAARDSGQAVHAALRISAKFGKKVSFSFNNVASPLLEQKAPVTEADVVAASAAFVQKYTDSLQKPKV